MKLLDEFIAEIKKDWLYKIGKLAYKSGVSYFTIYDWVRGRKTPTLVNAQKVANAMGYELRLVKKDG